MANTKSKIKIMFEGELLQAMRAVVSEFEQCGKVSGILLGAYGENKKIKLTDSDFVCVYNGVLNALNSHRYPSKKSNEYMAILKLKILLENEHFIQRGCEVHL